MMVYKYAQDMILIVHIEKNWKRELEMGWRKVEEYD